MNWILQKALLLACTIILTSISCSKKKVFIPEPIPGELPFFFGKEMDPIWKESDASYLSKGDQNLDSIGIRELISFELTDQNKNKITKEMVSGKVLAISFFFASCQGICPTVSFSMKLIHNAWLTKPNRTLLSFSITPDLDTPDILFKYGKDRKINEEKWKLLTGDKDKIYDLARISFNADTISMKENAKKLLQKEDFLHSESIYLVDQKGRLRGIYNGRLKDSVEDLLRDVELLDSN